ncbi:MAG: ABC transporter permease, partial [Raoultibacter sp.]
MIRLIFSDLRDNAMTWVGAFFVAVACGYIGGWAASLQTTASFCAGDLFLYKNLQSTVSLVISFSSIAGVAVLMSAANLTVLAQRRSYALWQLSNVRPLLVSAVVLAQLVVVAVLGALCGTLLAAVTFVPLFPLVFSARSALAQVKPHVGVSLMPNVWLVVAAVFLCGGARGARSAGKTPPLVVLREPEPQHQGMTWFRAFLFAGLAVCTYWLATFMVESGPSVALNCSLYVPILVVATLVPVAPAIFSALLAAWMSLVPKRWNAWYLARHTARYSLSASTSVETPIMVGFGLVAGLFSAVMCWVDYASRQGVTDLN